MKRLTAPLEPAANNTPGPQMPDTPLMNRLAAAMGIVLLVGSTVVTAQTSAVKDEQTPPAYLLRGLRDEVTLMELRPSFWVAPNCLPCHPLKMTKRMPPSSGRPGDSGVLVAVRPV